MKLDRPSFPPPPGFARTVPAPVAAAPASPPPEPGTTRGLVLVVDDSSMMLSLVAKILKAAGYAALLAESGVQAILVWERNKSAVNLVLSDVFMPGIDGLTLARELRNRRCTSPIVLMSSKLDDDSRWIAEEAGFRLLQKPFKDAELVDVVAALLP